MTRSLLIVLLAIPLAVLSVATTDAEETRMTPELLWKLGRLGSPTLSADGNQVAYTVRRYDLKENSGKTTLYVKDLKSGNQRELLSAWKSISDLQFADSPFGQRLYFTGLSGKQDDEKSQVWAANPTDGGVVQVTNLSDDDFKNAEDEKEGDDRTSDDQDDKRQKRRGNGVWWGRQSQSIAHRKTYRLYRRH